MFTNSASLFLSLPVELRYNIYEELTSSRRHRTLDTTKNVKLVEPCAPIPLLQTCRTINAELKYILGVTPPPKPAQPRLIVTLGKELQDPFELLAVVDAVCDSLARQRTAAWYAADPYAQVQIVFIRDHYLRQFQGRKTAKFIPSREAFKLELARRKDPTFQQIERGAMEEILKAVAKTNVRFQVRLRTFDTAGEEFSNDDGLGFLAETLPCPARIVGRKVLRNMVLGEMVGREEWEREWRSLV